MKFIIAGGSGFLGRALTESLLKDHHHVVLLSRNPARVPARDGVTVEAWDASTAGEWVPLLEGCDGVVNFSGVNLGTALWTKRRKAEILSSRQQAGQALIAGLQNTSEKPPVLIQASAVGYYGPSLHQSFTEEDPPGKDWLAGTAVAWENSTKAVEELGIRRVVTRTGLVLSRKARLLDRILLPHRFFIGGPLGGGKQWWSWIHIADEIGAIRFLLEHPQAAGIYNLTAPDPRQNGDFERALGKIIHRPAWFPTPAFPLRIVLGEMSTLVLDGQRVLPARLQASGYNFKFPVLEKALVDIFSG